jgi:hypothetical protein
VSGRAKVRPDTKVVFSKLVALRCEARVLRNEEASNREGSNHPP